jgi:hypothetical protein
MATQRARSPRDGSKINLQSLHARYNQVGQIAQCLRIAIESEAEHIEPAAVCRAIVDMLDDINSDLWTFLEPASRQKVEVKVGARNYATLRKRDDVIGDVSVGTNGLQHDSRMLNGNGAANAPIEDAAQ